MNEADIRKYAELMRELELTGLEITEGDRVVRLERSAPETVQVPVAPAAPAASAAAEMPARSAAESLVSVTSPLVGVFYASPAENAAPYVSVGDRVTKGQTLCIVEAMKLMNEVTAEEDGVIAEICVVNGQVVEYGTELFRIRR
ncbi:MAG TPA: acetyl-CoA carboxylase biotin carboxyl carrier protein [Candidatus Ventrousia excrementavium]|uniref:Biotin carboxyl carrier protein of acetyl-CoA carboxylase n=1 Tax=Candidatus Ventrousia excrementavium TaxID=2840961 RepID=A0A9D1LL82_9CLOT|nr:acetyl-CoA carboxylase biotin carboxyl carrier protein [Candidatus Ventrousia excrementavium]